MEGMLFLPSVRFPPRTHRTPQGSPAPGLQLLHASDNILHRHALVNHDGNIAERGGELAHGRPWPRVRTAPPKYQTASRKERPALQVHRLAQPRCNSPARRQARRPSSPRALPDEGTGLARGPAPAARRGTRPRTATAPPPLDVEKASAAQPSGTGFIEAGEIAPESMVRCFGSSPGRRARSGVDLIEPYGSEARGCGSSACSPRAWAGGWCAGPTRSRQRVGEPDRVAAIIAVLESHLLDAARVLEVVMIARGSRARPYAREFSRPGRGPGSGAWAPC